MWLYIVVGWVISSKKAAEKASEKSAIEMKVTRFSMNYCLVSFNGREDQLLTLEDAQKFADTVSAFFAG